MNVAEKHSLLDEIYKIRINNIKKLMSLHGTKTYKDFSRLTGIDNTNLTASFSGKSVISEKTARKIEESLQLEPLELDQIETKSVTTPVYLIDNLNKVSLQPLFYIDNIGIPKKSFYIQTEEKLQSLTEKSGLLLLFINTDSIKNLNMNDICLVKDHDGKHYVMKYVVSKYICLKSNRSYPITSYEIVAKCIKIEM